jgi:hypothetical protein
VSSIATNASNVTDLLPTELTQPDPPKPEATLPSPPDADVIATLHAGWTRRLVVPLSLWLVAFLSAALATGAGYRDLARWAAIGPGVVGLIVGLTLWSRRAVIRETGVEVTSLFGTRRVKYADVHSFTYDARSYRFYLPIPIGRVAELRLVGRKGRATFHAGFVRFDKYAQLIIERVVEASVQRMRSLIDRGEVARFGRRIKVDRKNLYLRRWLFRTRAIPLEDITIEVADGDFRISQTSTGKQFAIFALRNTPNLLALPQLIEELSDLRDRPHPVTLNNALTWNGAGG